jgi:hypothetical protein
MHRLMLDHPHASARMSERFVQNYSLWRLTKRNTWQCLVRLGQKCSTVVTGQMSTTRSGTALQSGSTSRGSHELWYNLCQTRDEPRQHACMQGAGTLIT